MSRLITAIGTPLDESEGLCLPGLERHLEDQWRAGIDGILVGGTMGAMQLLADQTYRQLAQHSVAMSRSRGEIMVGAGDAGFARTRGRIEFLNTLPIDGIVVLTPYFFQFTQAQLVDYFSSLADIAERPLYLYDLPVLTKTPIALSTYQRLAQHPNIHGAKISGRLDMARELRDTLSDTFRVIVAEPAMIDVLIRAGYHEHLDGMFAIAPHWARHIADAGDSEQWAESECWQVKLNTLRRMLEIGESDMAVFTAMMNARGISGRFHPAPFSDLTEADRIQLHEHPMMRELIRSGELQPQ